MAEVIFKVGEEVMVTFAALESLGIDQDPAVVGRLAIVIENATVQASEIEVQIDGVDNPVSVPVQHILRQRARMRDERE